jgi:hypothetical protein
MRFFRFFTRLPLREIIHLVAQTKPFMDYFKGFEKNRAVQGIFGKQTEEVLKNLKVDFIWFGYMGVSDGDGHLMVNKRYLNTGRKQDIYLDVIHELCHVNSIWPEETSLTLAMTMWIDQPKSKPTGTQY